MGSIFGVLLGVSFATGALLGVGVARGCSRPSPVVTPAIVSTPTPQAHGEATSSGGSVSNTSGSLDLEVVIPRRIRGQAGELPAHGGGSGMLGPDAPHEAPSSASQTVGTMDDEGPIVIRVRHQIAASASATSSAAASASVPNLLHPVDSSPDHSRLGVLLAYPVGLALDVEVLQLQVPAWLVGAPLEVGLDVTGNASQVGAGLSVGGKWFAVGGAWTAWTLGDRGLFLAIGARF